MSAIAAPALLAVVVLLVDLPGNMGCSDSYWSIPTAVSLVDHGDANLDEYPAMLEANRFHSTLQARGHHYTIRWARRSWRYRV
ncbi:MAG: hypothetical protein HY047_14535 [Acidobacteria bacterium]|nr:hypothetical protein [Acidobacteriota bacterium]